MNESWKPSWNAKAILLPIGLLKFGRPAAGPPVV